MKAVWFEDIEKAIKTNSSVFEHYTSDNPSDFVPQGSFEVLSFPIPFKYEGVVYFADRISDIVDFLEKKGIKVKRRN